MWRVCANAVLVLPLAAPAGGAALTGPDSSLPAVQAGGGIAMVPLGRYRSEPQ